MGDLGLLWGGGGNLGEVGVVIGGKVGVVIGGKVGGYWGSGGGNLHVFTKNECFSSFRAR